MEGKVRMSASTHSVGATVGTVSSAPVGWVGSGIHLLTPKATCPVAFARKKTKVQCCVTATLRVHGIYMEKEMGRSKDELGFVW